MTTTLAEPRPASDDTAFESADFYLGRGVLAEYLGTTNATCGPSALWPRFQSLGLNDYRSGDYLGAVDALIDTCDWPHDYTDSTRTPWAYAYDTGTVYIYYKGIEVGLIRCNIRRWVTQSVAGVYVEEFVPRRASKFPYYPPVTDTEG